MIYRATTPDTMEKPPHSAGAFLCFLAVVFAGGYGNGIIASHSYSLVFRSICACCQHNGRLRKNNYFFCHIFCFLGYNIQE